MAGRGMSSAMLAEIDKEQVYFFNLLEFEWPEDTDYLTDHPRELEWNGNTYLSTGDLLAVPTVSEQGNIQVNTVTLKLSGVNQSNVSKALSVNFIDVPVVIRRGFFDSSDHSIISDPIVLFKGYISTFGITEDITSGDSTLTWTLTSHWVDFERKNGRQTNDSLHRELYPGDRFFEYAGQTVEDFKWGRV